MDKGQIVQLFVCLFLLPFVLLPALGAGAVSFGYKAAGIPNGDFLRSWKVYLASCCYGFLTLLPLNLMLRDSGITPGSQQAMQLAVFCGTQLLIVPLLLKNFTLRALAVAACAVILANGLAYAALIALRLSGS